VVAVPPLAAQRTRALTVLHQAAREAEGRAEAAPSMVVIDTHLARDGSNGGLTFHDRGGAYGRTTGAKRVVAVDVTGPPLGALVVPASTHENSTGELGRALGVEVRRVGWDDKQPVFRPLRHAWRVEVPTDGSDAPAAWPSLSRTPPPRPPPGCRWPASRPLSAPVRPRGQTPAVLTAA